MKPKVWREDISIPTYECGAEEQNPIFLEKRVYQGSSGVVYPYPVIESISDTKTDHIYHAVWLENDYIKVMILPELGGRVQMAYDKIKQRHFVYYNHVVKPALVGLAGPWISGGIEFNWPQHHRPSTFMPVDCDIEEREDGSVVVWCSEVERMFHQKSTVGFCLRPGCAYLEINVRFYNRTALPQTFLWWANPAVSVNDAYQSVFPPDINAVFDHGKRAVSTFPIATGTYYKMDYSAGVDISNYKNIKVPTSYMGVNSKYDFEGGYENDTHGGMLHVADHHVSPGKKQWTWGNGDFGRAWDRNLTDEDGPYIELMAGVYTENQPDFSWIMPYEEKEFTQYFMPYRELGIVKQASRDLILNIEPSGTHEVQLKVLATSEQPVHIQLVSDDDKAVLYDRELTLSPEAVLEETIDVKEVAFDHLTLTIQQVGRHVKPLTWHAEPDEIRRVPDAAEAALLPQDCKTVEQLYLTGLHLEQYRHATWSALDYYEEGLRRDPLDVRCNNQLGLWYIRRGRFDKAEPYLRTAVRVQMRRNPNPYDGEPLYNLGLCLKYQGRWDEAYDMFYKATWNGAWQCAAYFACAQISVAQGRYEDALHELNRSLVSGYHNDKAHALCATTFRLMEMDNRDMIEESLSVDRFNYGCLYEDGQVERCIALMHDSAHNYLELATDYMEAGLWQEALSVLDCAVKRQAVSPMTHYYRAYALLQMGAKKEAAQALSTAQGTSPYCCFPNALQDILCLQSALENNTNDGLASYLLGCLYYDKRQYDVAISLWETSAKHRPDCPQVWRNLALAAYNKQHDSGKAVECMERAFHLDETDARILMELDQLYKVLQYPYDRRLANLRKYPALIAQRDDLILEEITLLNQLGQYEEAMHKLDAHKFHPWEGGEGKVSGQYQLSRVELAKQAIGQDNQRAIALLKECLEYPHHLGEGKLYGAQENDFYYLMGLAYEAEGNAAEARRCFEQATIGPTEPAPAMYYNDAKPDKIYYAALAYRKLGENDCANGLCYKLINYGEKHIFDVVRMDYFAVSLPDLLIWDGDLQAKNTEHCKHLIELGKRGLRKDDAGITGGRLY